MTHHKLKVDWRHYRSLLRGEKGIELSRGDRNFNVGDTLCLAEYQGGSVTGRRLMRTITNILEGVPEGLLVLGLSQ